MSTSKHTFTVAIADDNEIFSMALATLIENYDHLHLVGIHSNGELLIQSLDEYQPDIILMDVRMPKVDGIMACKIIHERYPEVKIVVISSYDDGHVVKQMMDAGAHSFFRKDITRKPFDDLLNSIIENKRYISPEAATNYALHDKEKSNPDYTLDAHEGENDSLRTLESNITPREKEVIVCLAKGLTNKEIANLFSVSIRTIDSHKRNIFEKTGIRKTTEAVALAYQLKWL